MLLKFFQTCKLWITSWEGETHRRCRQYQRGVLTLEDTKG